MRDDVKPLTPEDPLERAVEVFAENDLQELPVVNSRTENSSCWQALRQADIARRLLFKRVHAQGVRAEVTQQ